MNRKLGIVEEIDDVLQLLKRHLPYHESDHVLNIAYNVIAGGTRLEDIELLRQDEGWLDALGAEVIPDPSTEGDFLRRFGEDEIIELMEAIATRYGYPVDDIGGYIQPIEHNRACQMQFDIFYDPTSEFDVELVRNLYHDAIIILAEEGALFTRPYGELLV